ncbi:hypothetical protein VPH35_103810 [Triticum aestivum]
MVMAATAESVREQGLPGGVDVGAGSTSEGAAGAYGAGRAARKKAPPRPEARTEFRGVSRTRAGNYGARIGHSKVQTRWLGTFDTAEEAARAYDEAAVRLHGARAVTNYEQDGVSGSAGRAAAAKKKKPAAPRPDARTEFVGVSRQPNGKYFAGLWDSERQKVVAVGRFDTAVEAAGAYDAAATDFEQEPTAAAADDGDGSSVDLLSDFPEPPPCDVRSDSIIPGPALDDLRTDTDLTQAEWQQADEFLIDMGFAEVVD